MSNVKDETEDLPSGLYVVGTPIGNLGDFTRRAEQVLRQVDLILAEDTRHTRKLLSRYKISNRLVSCHRFNEASRESQLLEHLSAGRRVALVSDSGMPGISDPGGRTVRSCIEAGAPVFVVPGPSAMTSVLALSGWGGGAFIFEAFLSNRSAARQRRLKELVENTTPIVLYESPHRLLKLLQDIHDIMGDRPVFIGRELTKHFEETLYGTAAELLEQLANRSIKGECALVLGPIKIRAKEKNKYRN